MARTTKTDTKTASAAPSTTSRASSKRAPKSEAPEQQTETTAAVDTQNEVVMETSSIDTLEQSFAQLYQRINELTTQLNGIKTYTRTLEKSAVRELRTALKASSKRKRRMGNRQPSGFVKPAVISNELAAFLKRPAGSMMARTEVTREINGYIREHKLQDSSNGRIINPDGALSKLLKLKKGDELTYFNLQKYMSPHFQKATASTTA